LTTVDDGRVVNKGVIGGGDDSVVGFNWVAGEALGTDAMAGGMGGRAGGKGGLGSANPVGEVAGADGCVLA